MESPDREVPLYLNTEVSSVWRVLVVHFMWGCPAYVGVFQQDVFTGFYLTATLSLPQKRIKFTTMLIISESVFAF